MRAGAYRPGRSCRICGDPVKHHGVKGGAVSEWHTDARGVRKLALWHKQRCWPEEMRQRRAAAQQATQGVATNGAGSPVDELVLEGLPRVPAPPLEPPILAITLHERPPEEGGPGIEGPADPIPEEAPTSGTQAGAIVEHIGAAGKHRGISQAVREVMEKYPIFNIDDIARELTSKGITTTRATVVALVNQTMRGRPGMWASLRRGNNRYYKKVDMDMDEGIREVVTTQEPPPEEPILPREPASVTPIIPRRARRPREQPPNGVGRVAILQLIDRAYADLQELLIESRKELRKEVERLVGR